MSGRSIFRLSLFAVALLNATQSSAITPQPAPGLLPTEQARPLLEQDPGVLAARAGLTAGEAERRALRASPYDFNAKMTGQQRDVRGSDKYDEWMAGIERPIRLPGKATADRQLGETTVEWAEANVGEALHESARTLVSLWVDWLAAEKARELASASLESFGGSLAAVEKRVRAGDASRLELGTTKAELVEQRRLENEARVAADTAWTRLSVRFPGVERAPQPLPAVSPLDADVAGWTQRIKEQSDELKLALLSAEKAKAMAARAKAERFSDPTLGVFTASEVGGRERYTGVSVSLPFGMPGGYRSAVAARASADAETSAQQAELAVREFDAEIASAFVEARGAYDSWLIASEGASAMAENAALTERAYTLGEAGLQDLLIARRQAASSALSALQAQAAALKTYYTLVVDAHWVWDLDHE
jgi:outer membrane protein TolC